MCVPQAKFFFYILFLTMVRYKTKSLGDSISSPISFASILRTPSSGLAMRVRSSNAHTKSKRSTYYIFLTIPNISEIT